MCIFLIWVAYSDDGANRRIRQSLRLIKRLLISIHIFVLHFLIWEAKHLREAVASLSLLRVRHIIDIELELGSSLLLLCHAGCCSRVVLGLLSAWYWIILTITRSWSRFVIFDSTVPIDGPTFVWIIEIWALVQRRPLVIFEPLLFWCILALNILIRGLNILVQIFECLLLFKDLGLVSYDSRLLNRLWNLLLGLRFRGTLLFIKLCLAL